MKHEKIFKRADGSRVHIMVTLFTESYLDNFRYSVSLSICEPAKRTFRYVNDTDNYTWRRMNPEEKEAHEMGLFLKYASTEEIQETALELWDKIKPNFT